MTSRAAAATDNERFRAGKDAIDRCGSLGRVIDLRHDRINE
jgi:hypothetical protein